MQMKSGLRTFLRTGPFQITQIDKETRIPAPYDTSSPRMGVSITVHALIPTGRNEFGQILYAVYSANYPNTPLSQTRGKLELKTKAWEEMQRQLLGEVVWVSTQGDW